jgi:CheY-like chemotaxis protein
MDMQMPILNGVEAAGFCHGKVIFISGSASPEPTTDTQATKIVAHLNKPVTAIEFKSAIWMLCL